MCSPPSRHAPAWRSAGAEILESVWETTYVGNEHLVDVHIGHLRRKLGDDPADPVYVITVRGVGYRMGTGQDGRR